MYKKVAIITGGSSGIGLQTSLLFYGNDYKVYALARRVDMMKQSLPEEIIPLFTDLGDDDSVIAAIKLVTEREGRIDVLVNNAGFGIYGTVEDVPMSEARRQFDVNIFGLARVTQLVLPVMRRQGSGCIINISSVAGRMSMPLGTWYHASKHAVEALSDSLRGEVAGLGIRVVVIEPGIIDTDWWPVARQNLKEVSVGTAYGQLVEQGLKYLNDPGPGSDPVEVARVILKASNARRPRTRYRVGRKANLIVMAKKLLSDRRFDRIVRMQLEKSE